jgi:hypothetical protein
VGAHPQQARQWERLAAAVELADFDSLEIRPVQTLPLRVARRRRVRRVESRDDEGDVVEHVGLRFSPEHRVALANKRLLRRARAGNRDEAGADVHLDGYWDGPSTRPLIC